MKLHDLIGEWVGVMPTEANPAGETGRVTVRAEGPASIVLEFSHDSADGKPQTALMTLTDSSRQGLVGTFIASMMDYLWLYKGEINADGKLRLNTEGPKFDDTEGLAPYRDSIWFDGPDAWIMTSETVDADGNWTEFMRTTNRRA